MSRFKGQIIRLKSKINLVRMESLSDSGVLCHSLTECCQVLMLLHYLDQLGTLEMHGQSGLQIAVHSNIQRSWPEGGGGGGGREEEREVDIACNSSSDPPALKEVLLLAES